VHSDGISVASSGICVRYLRSQQREARGLDNDVIPHAVKVATQRLRVFQYTCWNGTDWIGQVNL